MKGIQAACIALVLLWVGSAANAWATTIMFTDRSSWQSAVAGMGYNMTNINFDNTTRILPGDGSSTVRAGDVDFHNNFKRILVSSSNNGYGSGNYLYFDIGGLLQVTMPSSYAFGFDFGNSFYPPLAEVNSPAASVSNVALSNGDVFAGPYIGNPYGTFAFLGFLTDAPITSLTMLLYGGHYGDPMIDNFTYDPLQTATAAPVPEPASLLLLGSGIAGLAALRKRFKKS